MPVRSVVVPRRRRRPVDGCAGRLFSIHEARHTTATLLLECGVDPAVIVAIMGHSILTTRGYQHLRTERAMAALDLVAVRPQQPSSGAGPFRKLARWVPLARPRRMNEFRPL